MGSYFRYCGMVIRMRISIEFGVHTRLHVYRRWRRTRKAAHEALNKVAARNMNDYQSEEALVLARSGLQNAACWEAHIRRSSANMLLRCLYDQSPVR